jgi:thiol-disulfide isomerase/thioredoxin
MKNILSILSLAAVLAFSACDKVDSPFGESGGGTPIPTDSVVKKVLLEDFTAFHCTNCPDGHRIAQQLKDAYGERLIVLSIHSSFLATPNVFGPLYTYDFRNPTSTDLYNALAPSAPIPIGCVNRVPYQNSVAFGKGSWGSAAALELAKDPVAGIKFDNITYSDATRAINGSVKIKFQSAVSDELSICFYTVEDSIIKPQLDNGVDITNYIHKHVLRGSLNTTWGESIGANHLKGEEKTVSFSGAYGPTDAIPEQGYVYAILINKTTREVLQVEEKHIK